MTKRNEERVDGIIDTLLTQFETMNEEMSFDPRIVQYVKDHNNWHAWDKAEYAMRGAPSSRFKIGFAGTATVIEVDTDKMWYIRHSNGDVPYPAYVKVEKSKYGRVELRSDD